MWRHLACLTFVAFACSKSSTEPVKTVDNGYALAVVVQGLEVWMGNDDFVPADDPSHYPGALKALKAAFAKSEFAKTAPAGSTGMLITYANKPTVRVPMGPIAGVTAAALGDQKDYKGTVSTELASAVVLAAAELDKAKGKKIMLVIGDGNDVNNDAAKAQFAKLKTTFASQGIDVIAIVYKAPLSGPANLTTDLTANTTTVSSVDALTVQVATTLDKLGK